MEDSDGVPVVVWRRIKNYQSWIGVVHVGMNEDIFKDRERKTEESVSVRVQNKLLIDATKVVQRV